MIGPVPRAVRDVTSAALRPALKELHELQARLASLPELVKVGENVRQLCKKNNVRFLHISPSNDPANPFFVNKQIDEGVMVFESNDEPSSITGREHSKRRMPV